MIQGTTGMAPEERRGNIPGISAMHTARAGWMKDGTTALQVLGASVLSFLVPYS